MIKTEVSSISGHEHRVDVTIPRSEYQRLYQQKLNELMAKNIRLPGFRPGKVPRKVVARQFSGQLREEVAQALLQEHYATALEKAGLSPASQPRLNMGEFDGKSDFTFSMLVTTWPQVDLDALEEMDFEVWTPKVEDADVDGVIEQLLASQRRYREEDKPVEQGDKVVIDYVGYLGDEPFDGGSAEGAELVIGSGEYIPGFEEQLLGARPGEHRRIELRFPQDYHQAKLAGRDARFEVELREVLRGEPYADAAELADALGFASVEALREDARKSLREKAEQTLWEKTCSDFDEALLARYPDIPVPDAILDDYVQRGYRQYMESRRRAGLEPLSDQDVASLLQALRKQEERKVRLAILYRALVDAGSLDVDDEALRAEAERAATEYPQEERENYVRWMLENANSRESLRSSALERKCVRYALSRMRTSNVEKSIDEIQRLIDTTEEGQE